MPLRLSPQQDQPPAQKGPGAQFAELFVVVAVALGLIAILVGLGIGVIGLLGNAPLSVAAVPALSGLGTAVLLFGSAVFFRRLSRRFSKR